MTRKSIQTPRNLFLNAFLTETDGLTRAFNTLRLRFLGLEGGVLSARVFFNESFVANRICPGRCMAYNTIFIIATATILSVLSIEHASDEIGKPILVKDEEEPGFV